MTLPVMPSTHRWFRGGPGLSKVGRNALFASDDTTVWVWDEETGQPVTDLLDENATPISAPKVVDGWVLGAGLPTAVRVASFSLGKDGKRYALEPAVNSGASAAAAASSATDAANSASDAAASAASVSSKIDVSEAAYDPSRSGAVGDGVTDDTTALQSALSTVRAAKGELRLRPNKTYLVGSPLDPTGARILAQGAILKAKSSGAGFNVLSATNGFTMVGGTIDPNKAGRTDPGLGNGNGIRVSNTAGFSTPLTIRDVTILAGWQAGIQLDGNNALTDPLTCPASNALLDNVTVTGTSLGFYMLYLAGIKVRDCTITSTGSDAILDHLTMGTSIRGCVARSAGRHSFITEYSRGFKATANTSISPSSGGYVVGGGTSTLYAATDFAITGNTADASGSHGYWVDTTLTTTPAGGVVPCYGTLTGNTVRGAAQHGIYLNHAQWLSLTGNTVRGASSAGILTMAKNVALDDNVFTGNAFGAYFAAAAAGFGEYQWGSTNINKGNTTQDWAFDANSVTGSSFDLTGSGAPTVAIPSGATATYRRVDGGAGTSFYVCQAGTWAGK